MLEVKHDLGYAVSIWIRFNQFLILIFDDSYKNHIFANCKVVRLSLGAACQTLLKLVNTIIGNIIAKATGVQVLLSTQYIVENGFL